MIVKLKKWNLLFGVSKFKIDTLKIMNNLKVEAYA